MQDLSRNKHAVYAMLWYLMLGVCRFTIYFYIIYLVWEYSDDFLSANGICLKGIGDYVTRIY